MVLKNFIKALGDMTSPTNSREALHFRRTVSPSTSGRDKFSVRKPFSIEKMMARFYVGQELDMEVDPFILNPDTGQRYELVRYPAQATKIAGDDDDYEFSISQPVEEEWEIVIDYENLNSTNSYDYVVNMDVDYAGGVSRMIFG